MKGPWKVFQNGIIGEDKFYQVGRVRDISRPVHSGNIEWRGPSNKDKALLQEQADKWNEKEAEKAGR